MPESVIDVKGGWIQFSKFIEICLTGWPYCKNENLEVKKISIIRIFKSIHKNCLMGFSHNMSILITITMLHPLL